MPFSNESKSTQEQKDNTVGETDSQKASPEVPPSKPPSSENTGSGSSPAAVVPNSDPVAGGARPA
ncbi:hypothetical protein A6V39_03740 [Candidatus Mycoplasma haematobovis]|uniref:Uncharacterized protein n=1 Tax=Candidatus Mycoplasma haematobovis TaxID=432608 RepID=A0A1A9QE68_9MOLU|nr:hypothetical protein [Candidatus Mycoplasma haematobovis]OAL09999.1 hypothetical protein A6V39_03740 [Candidatus Mycoplasma haematobovis]